MSSALLFADMDIVKVVFFLVVGGIWLLGKLLSSGAGNQHRPQPRRQINFDNEPAQANDEVSEFLRRAAQQRGEGTAGGIEVVGPSHEAPVEVEIIDDVSIGGGVGQHVRQHLDTHEFGDRASHLGHGVEEEVEELQDHLAETFDHQIGQFARSSSAPDPPTKSASPVADRDKVAATAAMGDIGALLQDPGSIRNAIVLKEILDRPEYRW